MHTRLAALLAPTLCGLALAACTPAAAVGESSSAAAPASVGTIAATDLSALVAQGKARLIDVRTPEEFASGHIPGATNIPLDTFDPAALGSEDGKETILYCRSGRRSGIAAEKLAEAEGSTVRHLDGGILAWSEAGQPVAEPGTSYGSD
jgi:rhodanese-related sulfurtransferase